VFGEVANSFVDRVVAALDGEFLQFVEERARPAFALEKRPSTMVRGIESPSTSSIASNSCRRS